MEIQAVKKQILTCQNCELSSKCRSPIPMTGKRNATFLVVGEAPGRIEDRMGKPFMGPAGQLLRKSLRSVGLDDQDGVYMNVVSCWPKGTPTPEHIQACRVNLRDQLEAVDTPWVLSCGGTALKAMVPHATLKDSMGRWIPIHGKMIMPVLHPAYFIHKPNETEAFKAWNAKLALFSFSTMWDDTVEEKCVYCNRSGWPACRTHEPWFRMDSKWGYVSRRNKKKGLQDERLF